MLAASLSLSALNGALAQSMGETSNANGSPSGDTTAAAGSSAATSNSTSASSSSSNSSGTTSSTSSAPATPAAPAANGTPAAAPTSDLPPGVLWTDPKHEVKEMPAPARVALPSKNRPTTGTTPAKPATPAPVADLGYDAKSAQAFADSVGNPQYVWTRQDKATKGQKATAVNATSEASAYNRGLVEKFVANMTVPNSATLVENSASQYVYLLSFMIDEKGKIKNINSEKQFGPCTAVNLADDGENATMTASITQALAKCSPVKVPSAGVPPWYMLLKYEPNTGKVFVANLNTI